MQLHSNLCRSTFVPEVDWTTKSKNPNQKPEIQDPEKPKPKILRKLKNPVQPKKDQNQNIQEKPKTKNPNVRRKTEKPKIRKTKTNQ